MYHFVYFIFLFLTHRFKYGQKEKIIHAIFVVLLVGMLNLGWLKIASNFLLQPGTNGSIQTKYILKPILIRRVLFNAHTNRYEWSVNTHIRNDRRLFGMA